MRKIFGLYFIPLLLLTFPSCSVPRNNTEQTKNVDELASDKIEELRDEINNLEDVFLGHKNISVTQFSVSANSILDGILTGKDADADNFSFRITNSATVGSYKDFGFNLICMSQTGSIIDTLQFTIYERLNPGESIAVNQEVKTKDDADSFNLILDSFIGSDGRKIYPAVRPTRVVFDLLY
ncbi:hypothetical protein N9P75_00285 [Schleiferiaceae bacterium]|nr:hypothetical protein [Schleiferiaceae bacterium]MDB0036993.1 hypothetical protein [Schleiferiaceae bacterium]